MYQILFLALISGSFFSSCSNDSTSNSNSQKRKEIIQVTDTTSAADSIIHPIEQQVESIPTVLIIPCANGYLYNAHAGDANPSLEKYLTQDERVEVLSFPYVEMKGAGYFGVYDKKHCDDILKNTDADFLIMTRMSGGIDQIIAIDSDAPRSENWGFSTKIVNTNTMEQFNGVSAKNLAKFEDVDSSVQKNASALVEKILASHSSEK